MRVRNAVVVSDIHAGCRFGLLPPKVALDGGVHVAQSELQRVMWGWWGEFWREWVPEATRGEPYVVVVNGDATDGRHHGTTTQVSQNLADQVAIASAILRPVVALPMCRALYIIRGTEAHVGPSAETEEAVADSLGLPRRDGARTCPELWLRVGRALVHCAHHIGTTGSQAYEATAVCRELVESFSEAARWRNEAPDVIVRSHRHRSYEVRCPTGRGVGIGLVTPGWQGKTPFAFRVAGGRMSLPQFGGAMIRDDGQEIYARTWTRSLARPAPVIVEGR